MIISIIISAITCFIIILTSKFHGSLSHDHDLSGIQKYHTIPTPRIGGLALFVTVFIVSFFSYYFFHINAAKYTLLLLITSIPVFSIGLIEDLFKNISPLTRLLFMLCGGLIAIYVTQVCNPFVRYLDFLGVTDFFTRHLFFYVIITLFFMIGISNCFNVIDGYNGLAGTTSVINFIGVLIIAVRLHDVSLIFLSYVIIGALVGFLLFNYPWGKIFLGDGGAYFVGFIMAMIMVKRDSFFNNQVSIYSLFLINLYPIAELTFSVIRRKFIHRTKSTKPDNFHLHQIIYHKLLHSSLKNKNSWVLVYMLALIIPPVILGVNFCNDIRIIKIMILGYSIYYVLIYSLVSKLKTIN